MITDEQVEKLRKLGYEADIAYYVREDPDDTASPVTKPVWYFRAPDETTHYLAEEDQADALIEQGKPLTAKQAEKADMKEQREAAKEADVVEPEEDADA